MIPFDLHTHCTLSFDGKSGAEDMVKRAVELGIKHYALTDHIDLGEFPDKDFDLEATDLVSVSLRSHAACDELCFRDISLVKSR